MSPTIFTHYKPDLDAFCSLWAVRRFVPGFANASIAFRPNSWDGTGMDPDDMAIDMELPNGRGIKGKRSAFAALMREYAPTEVLEAMRLWIKYVDMHDSGPPIIRRLAPHMSEDENTMMYLASIHGILLAAKRELRHRNNDRPADIDVYYYFEVALDGLLKVCQSQLRNQRDFDQYTEILHGGRIGLNLSGSRGMSHELYIRGVDVVIYQDSLREGWNIGITRPDSFDFAPDTPAIRAYIASCGDDPDKDWYAGKDTSGTTRFYSHGTGTNPATKPSGINIYKLAELVAAEIP